MEKDIIDGQLGPVHYDVEFKEGKLSLKADVAVGADLVSVKSSTQIDIPARAVIAALEKAIPGHFDDVALELLAKALGV